MYVEFLFVNAGVMNHILLFVTSSWCYHLPAAHITIRNYIYMLPFYNITPTKIVINYVDTGGAQRKSLFRY